MKRELIAASFCLLVTCMIPTLSARAIECLSAPNQAGSGWWSWREIDGRKCWYKKVGAMPPKSEFFWPEQAKEAPPAEERVPPAEERVQQELPMPATERTTATVPKVKMVRVKSVDLSNPIFRLSDGLIDLTKGLSLAGFHGVGGAWQTPPYIPADAFDARFGQW